MPDRLAAAVEAFEEPDFAVIDGGHFDDLPQLLQQNGLFSRSLFLNHAGVEVQQAGPWLVRLDQMNYATDIVLSRVGMRPAAVFWSFPGEEMDLHRHLRTLNMARIPAWLAESGQAPDPNDPDDEFRTAMFRHWDPRVLGALLPLLDEAQFGRVIGTASQIVYHAEDHGGLKRVLRDESWPSAQPGLLTITSSQAAALANRRTGASHRRIAHFLRSTASNQVAHQDDDALIATIRNHERDARHFGASNEDAIGMWCHMQVGVRENLSKDKKIVHFLSDKMNGTTVDDRLEKLFDQWNVPRQSNALVATVQSMRSSR